MAKKRKRKRGRKKVRMAKRITIHGAKAKRGERMTSGKGWRLATTTGRKRVLVGTLLGTYNLGNRRIATFSVPK